jgi:glucosamine--fructose-6-phosphate aminotransferase (isomerizing)
MPSFTFTEINSQPTVWHQTLTAFDAAELLTLWQAHHPQRVLFTGCGSTYYLSIIAANLFQALTGVPAQARPASELVLFPDIVFAPQESTLLIAISRSGTTTETIDAVKQYKTQIGSPVIVVTCDGNTPLSELADVRLVAWDAQEESVAQTRSFSSMLVLVEALCGALAGQSPTPLLASLPTSCERLLKDYAPLAERLGCSPDIERFFFLGSGFLYGMACEAMLKMKEMTLSYSEAFHCLEFRHGPMSMVNERTLIVGLLSEPVQVHEAAVLRQMHERGAQVLALSEHGSGLPASDRVHEVVLQSGLPAWARTVLYLPVLHLLAYHRALFNHQNPDRPANLTAVVTLDSLLPG